MTCRAACSIASLALLCSLPLAAPAGDFRVRLDTGDGFVIEDDSGATEHFRIDEATGDVLRDGQPLFRVAPSPNDSVFLGLGAGEFSAGTRNTAIGTQSFNANALGFENAAFGFSAMEFSQSGNSNAAFGAFALLNSISGSRNVALGKSAMSSSIGSQNVAVGAFAGSSIEGNNNVAVGDDAMRSVTGFSNIAIGPNAGASLSTGDDNIYIGNSGNAAESRKIRIGAPGVHTETFLTGNTSTAGTLAVGTTTADRDLTILDVNSDGGAGINIKATTPAARELLLAVNQSTGGVISMQTNNALDFRTNADSRLYISASGQVGIETTTPSHPLQVGSANGAHVTAGGTWTNGSSREFKHGFEAVDPEQVLERLSALPISRWHYRGEGTESEGAHLGPVAEDFAAAFGLGGDDRYIATVDADGVALAAIQGLHAIVEAQRAELDLLRARLEKLESSGADPTR